MTAIALVMNHSHYWSMAPRGQAQLQAKQYLNVSLKVNLLAMENQIKIKTKALAFT